MIAINVQTIIIIALLAFIVGIFAGALLDLSPLSTHARRLSPL